MSTLKAQDPEALYMQEIMFDEVLAEASIESRMAAYYQEENRLEKNGTDTKAGGLRD